MGRRTRSRRSPQRSPVLRRPSIEKSRCARCRPAAARDPLRAAAATSSSPAATISSLLATAIAMPRSTAANTASNATAPSVAAKHDVRLAARRPRRSSPLGPSRAVVDDRRRKAARPVRASSSTLRPAASATTSKRVRVPRDHVERLRADRARRPQNRDSLARRHVDLQNPQQMQRREERRRRRRSTNRSGRARRRAPGSLSPASFTPASRLSADSTRSPACAAMPVQRPSTPPCHHSKCSCGSHVAPTAKIVTMTSDPNEPSMVLLGETCVSWCCPKSVPTTIPKMSVSAMRTNDVERQPHPVTGDLPHEDEIRQQFADVQNGEQRVGGAGEVPFLLAVHADPERRDDDRRPAARLPTCGAVRRPPSRRTRTRRGARPDTRAADLFSRTAR